MTEVCYVEIQAEEHGQRLDNYLLRVLKGVPRSHIYRIVRGGEVRVNKKRAPVSQRLATGDKVRIPPIRQSVPKKTVVGVDLQHKLEQSILYEDERLLVINKPTGVAVHGGSGLSVGVIEALRHMRSDLPYLELVHRLDKETSGCLMLAKKRSMLRAIQSQLEARSLEKTYWAVVRGAWVGKSSVCVDLPLKKNTLQSGERMVVVSDEGKASRTHFHCLERDLAYSFIEAKPTTGRTHQIRVHSAALGHPIVGDHKYDLINDNKDASRLHLHARSIHFQIDGKDYSFTAPVDETFSNTLLRFVKSDV